MIKRHPFLFMWLTTTLLILIVPVVFFAIRDASLYDEFYEGTRQDNERCVEKAGTNREYSDLCSEVMSQSTHAFTSAMSSNTTSRFLVISMIYGLSLPTLHSLYSFRKRIEKLEGELMEQGRI